MHSKKTLALATALIQAKEAILAAYAFGSKIGGPPLGFLFAGVATAATAVHISSIAGATFSGGRASGGDVYAKGMYQVNEQGPELLSVGNKDYLMMGSQSGAITSNKNLGGGRANVVVNIYPQSGETAQVQSREEGDSTQIDVVIEQIEEKIASGVSRGDSTLATVIESQYGLNRAAGSRA